MAPPTSNLNTILERIQAIQLSQAGIKAAFAYTPGNPSSGDLPFYVNAPSPGVGNNPINMMAQQLFRVQDRIEMALCVSVWNQDNTLADNLKYFYGWRDLTITTFAQHVKLSLVAGQPDLVFIIDAYLNGWEGAKKTYGSTDFAAFTFELVVREAQFLTVTG
jgi:hypothetical protein